MILIIGAGAMAQEYVKVLKAQRKSFLVIGRSETSAEEFKSATGIAPFIGGLELYLSSQRHEKYFAAIVTTGVEQLASTTRKLLEHGVDKILVEKPAGLDLAEIKSLVEHTMSYQASVYVAYNRRYYSSVLEAQSIITIDGGVKSFNFEITEWGHVIGSISKGEGVKENWFLANTTHVADMAFFLGGFPREFSSFISGGSKWHTRSYNFSGAGVSEKGALFAYHGNWGAPGRWGVEILTSEHRLIFRPLEKLQIQKLGSVAVSFVEIDDRLDVDYKPGLYKQVEAFLTGDESSLCDILSHSQNAEAYIKMAGYN